MATASAPPAFSTRPASAKHQPGSFHCQARLDQYKVETAANQRQGLDIGADQRCASAMGTSGDQHAGREIDQRQPGARPTLPQPECAVTGAAARVQNGFRIEIDAGLLETDRQPVARLPLDIGGGIVGRRRPVENLSDALLGRQRGGQAQLG